MKEKINLTSLMTKSRENGFFSYRDADDLGDVLVIEGEAKKFKFKAFCRENGSFVAKLLHESAKRKRFSILKNDGAKFKKHKKFFDFFVDFVFGRKLKEGGRNRE